MRQTTPLPTSRKKMAKSTVPELKRGTSTLQPAWSTAATRAMRPSATCSQSHIIIVPPPWPTFSWSERLRRE